MNENEPLMADQTLTLLFTMLRRGKCQTEFLWTDECNDIMKMMYSAVLADKPDWIGKWLLLELPRRFKWRPEPAELQEIIIAKMGLLPPTTDEAYAQLLELRRVYGPYGQPNPNGLKDSFVLGPPPVLYDFPALARCVDALGGWLAVCNDENPVALRAHFAASYQRTIEREKVEAKAPPISHSQMLTARPVSPTYLLEGE